MTIYDWRLVQINKGDTVSIVVVAYNSEKTIIETLESIARQNYDSLELIVSDDASTDKTYEIAVKWYEGNKNRFTNVIIQSNKVNKGVSANINIALSLANYEWVKIIAADDLLLYDCISSNVDYVVTNNVNSVVTSKTKPFIENSNGYHFLDFDSEEIDYIKKVSKLEASKQYKKLLIRDILNTPTMFYNKAMYEDVGGCDERIRNIEDWVFKLRVVKSGYKIHFMDKETVMYRIGDSISYNSNGLYNVKHIEHVKLLKRVICYPNIPKWNLLYYYQEGVICIKDKIIISVFNNRNNACTRLINKFMMLLLPRKWSKLPRLLSSRIFRK